MPFDVETRVAYKDGEKIKVLTEKSFNEMNEELSKKGEPQIEALYAQSCEFPFVSEETPLEELATLVPNKAQEAAVINRGLILYEQQYINRLLTSKDFTPVEGNLNLTVALEKIGTRQSASRKDVSDILSEMSPEKVAEILAKLPQEKLNAIFAKM